MYHWQQYWFLFCLTISVITSVIGLIGQQEAVNRFARLLGLVFTGITIYAFITLGVL
jgi:hypothetical protein